MRSNVLKGKVLATRRPSRHERRGARHPRERRTFVTDSDGCFGKSQADLGPLRTARHCMDGIYSSKALMTGLLPEMYRRDQCERGRSVADRARFAELS